MKTTTIVVICLFVAVFACNVNAAGPETGWRVGGSAVTSKLDRDDGLVDDTNFGFKLFAQYKFNSWFGVEGNFFDSGGLSSDQLSAGGTTVDLVYDGFIFQGIGYIPVPWEQFEIYLKGGYFDFDVDLTIDGSDGGRGSDGGAVLGTGVSFGITESFGLRTEFDWFDTAGADFWTIGLGLEYRF